jgi:hypothetical protein
MWTVTNQQADPMTFTLDDGTVVNAPAKAGVQVASGVYQIAYHQLSYTRNGIWPFPDNQALNAFYPGGNNLHIQNPTSRVEAVYPSD